MIPNREGPSAQIAPQTAATQEKQRKHTTKPDIENDTNREGRAHKSHPDCSEEKQRNDTPEPDHEDDTKP